MFALRSLPSDRWWFPDDKDLFLQAASGKCALDGTGYLDITVSPDSQPLEEFTAVRRAVIMVYKGVNEYDLLNGQTPMFIGYVDSVSIDFRGNYKIRCSDILSAFKLTITPQVAYSSVNFSTATAEMGCMIDAHNKQVPECMRFDSFASNRSADTETASFTTDGGVTTQEGIQALLDKRGGYLYATYESDKLKLTWYGSDAYVRASGQTIDLYSNLTEFTESADKSGVYNAVIPLTITGVDFVDGEEGSIGKGKNKADIRYGLDHCYYNQQAGGSGLYDFFEDGYKIGMLNTGKSLPAKYEHNLFYLYKEGEKDPFADGMKIYMLEFTDVEYEDVTDYYTLDKSIYKRALRKLKSLLATEENRTYSLNAVDFLNPPNGSSSKAGLHAGDRVSVYNAIHGIQGKRMIIQSIEFDLFNPQNDRYTFGSQIDKKITRTVIGERKRERRRLKDAQINLKLSAEKYTDEAVKGLDSGGGSGGSSGGDSDALEKAKEYADKLAKVYPDIYAEFWSGLSDESGYYTNTKTFTTLRIRNRSQGKVCQFFLPFMPEDAVDYEIVLSGEWSETEQISVVIGFSLKIINLAYAFQYIVKKVKINGTEISHGDALASSLLIEWGSLGYPYTS